MAQYSLVLFDIGGVVVFWHDAWLYDKVSKMFEIPLQDLSRECEKEIKYLHAGKLSEFDFWSIIGKRVGSTKLTNVGHSLIYDIFKENAKINKEILDLMKKIQKQKIKTGYLSNLETTTNSILEEFDLFSGVEFQFLSHKIGFAKPDMEIFKYVLENLPFKKDQILFVDDKPLNVETANSVGIKSIQYTTNKKLESDLQQLGVL